MPRFDKYPQYPNTRGWISSDDDQSEDDTKPQYLGNQSPIRTTKQEPPRQSSSVIKQEEMDDSKPFQVNRRAMGSQSSRTVENHDEKTKRANPYKRAYQYDWAGSVEPAKERAKHASIVELPASEVSRVVKDGKFIGVCHLQMFPAKHFITYDGFDVMACVPKVDMIDTIIYELASLHIGHMNQTSHPDHIKLETHWAKMNGNSGYAVHVYPKAISSAKKTKGHKSHTNC